MNKVEKEFTAIVEEFKRISNQITEHSKLQYQLVGVAYAIGGAALTFWSGTANKVQPIAILFFPPLFCAIVLVQLYLHSTIKSSSRYINFYLRPRMEEIVDNGVWRWEEYYVESHRMVRYIIRQFGSVVIVINLLPAIGALIVFVLVETQKFTGLETFWLVLDIVIITLTFALVIFVKLINERWWKIENQKLAQRSSVPS